MKDSYINSGDNVKISAGDYANDLDHGALVFLDAQGFVPLPSVLRPDGSGG